jgi:S1-C subfamily serine protease
VADYTRLLARAGFTVRKRNPGRAWLGDVRLESREGGWRVVNLIPPTWPIYAAGIDQDDDLQRVDGQRITDTNDLASVILRHKPGDTVPIVFVDRTGAAKTASVRLAEDPRIEVTVQAVPSAAQRAFRDSWLGAK